MTPEDFQSALELFDRLSKELYRAYRDRRREHVRQALGELKELAASDVMPYVQITLGVLDRKHRKTITFGSVDVSYCNDKELLVLGRDATPRTFLIDGNWVTLPEDQCPCCLGEWKLNAWKLTPCPGCGAVLGEDLKVAIVNGRCPFCEDEQPPGADECDCGFNWNADYAVRR